MDTMLSVDSGPDNILYRIRRDDNRIVYVTVTNPDAIPEDDRTYGPSAIAELGKLKEWNDTWRTLQVHKNEDRVWCEPDVFPPHAVAKQQLMRSQYPIYDISSLTVVHEVKSRTFEVRHDGELSFLKIARFAWEVSWLTREIQAYHALEGTLLAPKLIGYVYEQSPDRIIGFLTEKVDGRFPGLDDLEVCTQALRQLHGYLIHGDLCKYNILISGEKPKFIDFEDCILVGTDEWSDFLERNEMDSLRHKLADISEVGRPWLPTD